MNGNNGTYTTSSPYAVTDIVDNEYLDFMTYRPIRQDPNDVYYKLPSVYENRPDLLAFDLYGNSKLWWVFAARNPNLLGPDPYFNFKAGIEIYIPNVKNLKKDLGI